MAMEIINVIEHAHERVITCLAYNRTKGQIYSAAEGDTGIKVWDVSNGDLVRVQAGHTKQVTSLLFAASVKLLFSGCTDSTVGVWTENGVNLEMVEVVSVFPRHPIHCISWNSRRHLIAASCEAALHVFKVDAKAAVDLQQQHRVVASGVFPGSGIDMDRPQVLKRVCEPIGGPKFCDAGSVKACVITNTGKIVTGGCDTCICVYDCEQLDEPKAFQHTSKCHNAGIVSMAYNSCNNVILTGSVDGSMTVWSMDGRLLQKFESISDKPLAVACIPRTNVHWASGRFGRLVAYDPRAPANITEYVQESNCLSSYAVELMYSPAKTDLLLGATNTKQIVVWQYNPMAAHRVFRRHADWVECVLVVRLGPEGEPGCDHIFSAATDGRVLHWGLDTEHNCDVYNIIEELEHRHEKNIYCMAYSPHLHCLITGGQDAAIQVYYLDGNVPVVNEAPLPTNLVGHEGRVSGLALLEDDVLLSVSYDKSIRLWDLITMKAITVVTGAHDTPIQCLDLAACRREVATCGMGNKVKIWAVSQRCAASLALTLDHAGDGSGDAPQVSQCRWVNHRQVWVTAADDDIIRIWSTEGVKMHYFTYTGGSVQYLYVDDLNQLLLAAMLDKSAYVYDLDDPLPKAKYTGHSDVVRSMALIPERQCYVTASWDKSLRLWWVPSTKRADHAESAGETAQEEVVPDPPNSLGATLEELNTELPGDSCSAPLVHCTSPALRKPCLQHQHTSSCRDPADLPLHSLQVVIDSLALSDVLSCRAVSKRWAETFRLLVTRVTCCTGASLDQWRSQLQAVCRCFPGATAVVVYRSAVLPRDSLAPYLTALASFPQLTSLLLRGSHCTWDRGEVDLGVVSSLSSLSSLHLDASICKASVPASIGLQLRTPSCVSAAHLRAVPLLRHLQRLYLPYPADDVLMEFEQLSSLSRLTSVCFEQPSAGVGLLSHHVQGLCAATSLRSLEFAVLSAVSEHALVLLTRLVLLESLSLSIEGAGIDVGHLVPLSQLRHLTHLALSLAPAPPPEVESAHYPWPDNVDPVGDWCLLLPRLSSLRSLQVSVQQGMGLQLLEAAAALHGATSQLESFSVRLTDPRRVINLRCVKALPPLCACAALSCLHLTKVVAGVAFLKACHVLTQLRTLRLHCVRASPGCAAALAGLSSLTQLEVLVVEVAAVPLQPLVLGYHMDSSDGSDEDESHDQNRPAATAALHVRASLLQCWAAGLRRLQCLQLLGSATAAAADLRCCSDFLHLTELGLKFSAAENMPVAGLELQPCVRALSLGLCEAGAIGAAAPHQFSRLETLSLCISSLPSLHLHALAARFPRLQSLTFKYQPAHALSDSSLGGQLELLTSFSGLRALSLHDFALGTAAFAALATLTGLKTLSLWVKDGVRIDDLGHVSEMKGLRRLEIKTVRWSVAAIRTCKVEASFPWCEVVFL